MSVTNFNSFLIGYQLWREDEDGLLWEGCGRGSGQANRSMNYFAPNFNWKVNKWRSDNYTNWNLYMI